MAVMMPVASQHGPDAHVPHNLPIFIGPLLRNSNDGVQAVDGIDAIKLGIEPMRLGNTQHNIVVAPHALDDCAEVVLLRGIEILGELDIDAPQPPVVRQLNGPIAAVLEAAPAANPAAVFSQSAIAILAEQAVEGGKSIIPIMIAWQGEELALFSVFHCRHGAGIGQHEAFFVFFVRGLWVTLVAPKDQNLPGGQRLRANRQLFLGEQQGHAIGGPEAVGDVGDIVNPNLLVIVVPMTSIAIVIPRLKVRATVRRRLHEALVGVFPEHRRYGVANANADQDPRIVPAHRLQDRLGLQASYELFTVAQHDVSPVQSIKPSSAARMTIDAKAASLGKG